MSKRCISLSNLQSEIDSCISWRRRELNVLFSVLQSTTGKKQEAIIRSFIPILYAHWEGFVKQSCSDYIQHISMQSLKYTDLKSVFIVLKMRNYIESFRKKNDFEQSSIALEYILTNLGTKSHIPYKNIIDTKSNLSFDVFSNIMYLLAIDISQFNQDKQLITDLLELRNFIAHGEQSKLDFKKCKELYEDSDVLLNKVKDAIMDSATLKRYIR